MTRIEQAAALGVSVRTLYRRLADERAGEAEWLDYPEPIRQPDPPPVKRPGPEALPYVPLVSAESRGLHYRLDADAQSILPDCPFRIARGRGRGWTIAHRDDRYGDRPGDPNPSRRKFRPNGLGRKRNRTGVVA